MSTVRTVKHETDVVVPKAGETYVAEDGTVSQVLDDHVDADYEPTEEELLEFADWIGMKLPQDSEFLWLARDALKTPLPKEWKPCSTGDGEVYYFNFKTGESSWDHPMDQIFRRRFQEEKTRVQKLASEGTGTVSTSTTRGLTSGVQTSTPPAMLQTHVMMTETGVLRRDRGGSVVPGLSPVASTTITAHTGGSAKGLSTSNAHNEVKQFMHSAPQQHKQNQQRGTETATHTKTALQSSGATDNKSVLTTSILGIKKVGVQDGSSPGSNRILSEAERALEERVHREMQLALEAERSKIEDTHRATMSALQKNFDNDVANIRNADAARRTASLQKEEEERERRLQQTRNSCEERYGDELRSLEREVEANAKRLQKLEAEAARATSGNTQRTAIEAELKIALAKQRAEAEAEAEKQHRAVLASAVSAHAAAMQRIRDEEQRRITTARQTWQRKLDMEERTVALQTEAQRKQLEGRLRELEEKLAGELTRPSSSVTTASSPATVSSPLRCRESLSERLAKVAAAKAARLGDIEAATTLELSEVRAGGEAALVGLTKQLEAAQEAGRLASIGAKATDPLNRGTSCTTDRLGVTLPQGGAQTASAALSVAFTEELNRVRLAWGRERQERLSKLRADREAALAAVETPPLSNSSSKIDVSDTSDGGATTPKGRSCSGQITVEGLKAAHAAELEAKRTLYTKIEEDLKHQYACEVVDAARAATPTLQSALVAKAVDTEMNVYIQEATARYDRMRTEATAKRDKALADHQLAMDAYERRKAEAAARHAREQEEAREALIQDRLHAAIATERAKLAADHKTTMTRLAARYDEERGVIKAEVEEEVLAYKAAEEEQIKASVGATRELGGKSWGIAGSSSPEVQGRANTAALCAHVMEQSADRQAEWLSRKRSQAEKLSALETKRSALQTEWRRVEEHVQVLQRGVADLAAASAAAEVEKPSPSSTSAPVPLSSAPSLANASAAGGLLRATHETSMQVIEQGYHAHKSALEAELQTWRDKTHALQQSQPRLSSASNSYGTPRQQVLVEVPGSGGAAMCRSSTPYALNQQPSPIAPTPACTSLQGTPMIPASFEDFPGQFAAHAGVPPPQPAMAARGPSMTSGFLSTSNAILSYEQRQRSLQQRQASLHAAREAWQLRRRLGAEAQQPQRHHDFNLTPAGGASQSDGRYEANGPSTLGADSLANRRREEELRLVLSRLSERLDAVTREALQQQQQPRRQDHRRSQSVMRVRQHAEVTSSRHGRALSACSTTHHTRGPLQRGEAGATSSHPSRFSPYENAVTSVAPATVPPRAKSSSHMDNARVFSRQQSKKTHVARYTKERDRSGVLSTNLSGKWEMLLSPHHHRYSR